MNYKDLASSFGITKTQVQELVYSGGYTDGGIIRSIPSTKETLKRISPEKLEEVYFKDPITFNTINKSVQMLSAAGDRIIYNSTKEEKVFTDFFENLAKVGKDSTWEELKNYIWFTEELFGGSWIELIWDQNDEEILDLGRLDPKVMDYTRDGSGNIILDDNQKPIGYIMKLPYGVRSEGQGDKVPDKWKKYFRQQSNEVFLLPKRVALIPLFTLSDGYNYVGLVEPAYDSIKRKLMLEEAGTNSAYQRWTNPLIGYVGDEKHPPTANLANQTLQTMKGMKHDLYSTYPYYVKLETLDSKPTEALNEILKYLRENQSAASGMPMPLSTGAGEATNRSTLNNMQNLMEFTLNDIAKRTAANITKYILKPVAESKGLKTYPKMIANKVNIDEIDDFAVRMNNYVKNGNLLPEDVRDLILDKEGIILDDKTNEDRKNQIEKDKQDKANNDFKRNEQLGLEWKEKQV